MENFVDYLKKHYVISISLIAIVAIIITLLTFNTNDTYALQDDKNSISMVCPENAKAGSEIECKVILNAMLEEVEGVELHYNLGEGLNYIDNSYTSDIDWTVKSVNDNGIVAILDSSNDYLSGSIEIGKVRFKIPDSAVSNTVYTLGFSNSNYSNPDKEDIVNFDDSYCEVRVLSDINTLSNISIDGATINEEFASDNLNYTAISDRDKIVISALKTDDKSIVSGDIGEVTLHYGTNNFNIIVTSETGSQRIYKIAVKRNYEFSSDYYIYNKEDNYIYTKSDQSSDKILSNISLSDELNASIDNNKLNIKYGSESLIQINVINIGFSKYSITNGNIYIDNDLNYDSFIKELNINQVNVKIFDSSDKEVVSGILKTGDKLNVYYNDILIDSYNFKVQYLNFNDVVKDDTNKVLKRISSNTKYSDFKKKISTSGTINIKSKDNKVMSDSDIVKTGDIIEIKLNDITYNYTFSVLGDLTGTGDSNLGDVAKLYKGIKTGSLKSFERDAGDVTLDGNVNIGDVAKLYGYIKGRISSLEG